MDQSQTTPQPANAIHPQEGKGKDEKVKEEERMTISKTEYEKLKRDAAEHLDGWKRAKADYINFKRETEQRQAAFSQFAAMAVLIGVIPVYDHLRTAAAHLPAEMKSDPWADGVLKIRQEFEKCLKDAGVEAMIAEGQPFDPARHEALGSEAREGVAPHMVVREVKAGYLLHGKVLIPAQVIVSGG